MYEHVVNCRTSFAIDFHKMSVRRAFDACEKSFRTVLFMALEGDKDDHLFCKPICRQPVLARPNLLHLGAKPCADAKRTTCCYQDLEFDRSMIDKSVAKLAVVDDEPPEHALQENCEHKEGSGTLSSSVAVLCRST